VAADALALGIWVNGGMPHGSRNGRLGASSHGSPDRSPGGARRPSEVVVAGGGIAGLEALLALRHLAGERASLTLVSPEPELVYRPMTVEEPFSLVPAERRDLAGIAAELDTRFIRAPVGAVDPEARAVLLEGSAETVPYDAAVICVGARRRAPFRSAATLPGFGEAPSVNEMLARAAAHPSRRIAFIVPPGVSWPLPIYEIALMAARRAAELGYVLDPVIVTPEAGPLIMFGPIASRRLYEVLRARGISFLPAAYAGEDADGIVLSPGRNRLEVGSAIALPVLEGPAIEGVPRDPGGFIPIDDHARVRGTEDLYAAGDGTNFPIKQGGIATQQADAAAEQIAAGLGCLSAPKPFQPVLRGKLILGEESLHLRASVAGDGEGIASEDYLWWPPHKVGSRYLARWLDQEIPRAELEAPGHPIDVEVSLPSEWHREPMALDPYASLSSV
jgi:sulfide:quinone oxidoreductase